MPTLTLRSASTAKYGTMQDPVPWTLPIGGVLQPQQAEVSFLLSYDTLPSTTVYVIEPSKKTSLRIDRISEDRYASAVGVSLYDDQARRVATLVSSADGRGETVELAPGRYRVVAANHLPETIPITLRASVSLVAATLGGGGGTVRGGLGVGTLGFDSVATTRAPLQEGVLIGFDGSELSDAALLIGGGAMENGLLGIAERAASNHELSIRTIHTHTIAAANGAASVDGDESLALKVPFEWVDRYGAPLTGVEALDYDREVHRRSDFEMLVTLRNPDGSPLDLTGMTIDVELWDELGETQYGDLTVLASPGPGVIYALLPTALSLTLPEVVIMRTYLTDGLGNRAYPLRGRWTLIEGYTA